MYIKNIFLNDSALQEKKWKKKSEKQNIGDNILPGLNSQWFF